MDPRLRGDDDGSVMPVITDSKVLKDAIEALRIEDFVAIDTEFARRNTYYAKLCLVQVAGATKAFAVDPLVPGLNLKPLSKLLKSRKILKVFHSAREDVEVIYHSLGVMPKSLFDTQIAANLLGYGATVSYAGLLETMTGLALDKTQRYSDWRKRPLSRHQIEYALADVVHLREIYAILSRELQAKNLEKTAKLTMKKLLERKRYVNNPKLAWEKIGSRGMSGTEIKNLKKLAGWREKKAQEIDIPRQWVVKDMLLRKIARLGERFPETLEKDKELQSLFRENKVSKRFLQEMKELV